MAAGSGDTDTPTGDGNYDETYTFNAAGDITSKTGQGTYTYNDPDHVHAATSTSTGSVFTYNDDGDMVTRKTGDGPTQALTWNMEERLETVTENGTTSTYLYAENGARTRTNTDNDYTYYHGNTEYRHNPDTGDISWTYAHNFGGQTVAVTVDGDTSWLFADQIGSNSLAVTETGAVSVQRYTPWGETRVDGGLPTQRGYTGQIEDENTGLSYYNARYYDPTIGRFISPDTIIPNPSNGQDYNRYAYVNNRPIIANDPTGHTPCPPGDGGCARELEYDRLADMDISVMTPAEYGFVLGYVADEQGLDREARELAALDGLVMYSNAQIDSRNWCPGCEVMAKFCLHCSMLGLDRNAGYARYEENGSYDYKPLLLAALDGERWFTTIHPSYDVFFDVPTNWATAQVAKTTGNTLWGLKLSASRGGKSGQEDAGDVLSVELSWDRRQFEDGTALRGSINYDVPEYVLLQIQNPHLKDYESKVRSKNG